MAPSGDSGRRVLIIGLDCAAPEFVFKHPDYHLPNLHRLMDSGSWGPLRSCDPPITVPAWSCMMSGRDPGELGVYGFTNRRSYDDYKGVLTGTSLFIKKPRLWDLVKEAARNSIILCVPQTYPVAPVRGCLVSGMLTPGNDVECTSPAELRDEIVDAVGDLQFDVSDFRTPDKENLFKRICSFLENRFDVATYLMNTKPWDLFMMVEMGLDRLHHAFWQFADEAHPRFQEDSPFRWHVKQYYERMDERIGELLGLAGPDVAVMVVSDHGAKAMHGGIRLNQWLIDNGYLHLKQPPKEPEPFDMDNVDWSKTVAWGDGGYYGRIFLNVAGREPEGIVRPEDVDTTLAKLTAQLQAMRGPNGASLGNSALRPENIYRTVRGIAPDLLVYFGDLHWRSLGEVGAESIYAETNDTGPDDANHAMEGIVILNEGGGKRLEGASIYDIAPTALRWMNVPEPVDLRGRSLVD